MPNETKLKGFYSTTSHSVFFEFYCPKTFYKTTLQLPKSQTPDTLFGLLSSTRPGFSIQGALSDMELKHNIEIINQMALIEEATSFAFMHFYHHCVINYVFYKTHHIYEKPLLLNNFTEHMVEGCLVVNVSDVEKSITQMDFQEIFEGACSIYHETGKFIINHAQLTNSSKEK